MIDLSGLLNQFKKNWGRDVRAMRGDPMAQREMYSSFTGNSDPNADLNVLRSQYMKKAGESMPIYGGTVASVGGGASTAFMEAMKTQEGLMRKKGMLERLLSEETSPAYKTAIRSSLKSVDLQLRNILKGVFK